MEEGENEGDSNGEAEGLRGELFAVVGYNGAEYFSPSGEFIVFFGLLMTALRVLGLIAVVGVVLGVLPLVVGTLIPKLLRKEGLVFSLSITNLSLRKNRLT